MQIHLSRHDLARNVSRLAMLAMACVAMLTLTAQAESKMLFDDFKSEDVKRTWATINDSVMGGVSKGSVTVNKQDMLVFSGDLSLENNGGFSSIRTWPKNMNLGDDDALRVRIKGDGRTYYLDLRTTERRMASSYRFPIKTVKGKWIDITAPFDEFYYTSFGRRVDRAPIQPADIRSVGFTLADKKAGKFKLEIESIEAVKNDTKPAAKPNTAKKSNDIVDVATEAGQFKTLLAAAKAAGLAEALKNPDATLTVFAPTDDAFAKLPAGTVESLLQPENKDKLIQILTYHVLAEPVRLGGTVKTLQGDTLTLSFDGDARIGDANIVTANIETSNGVIHVIDQVLIPDMPEPTASEKARRMIELAIERGVPQFNSGNAAACAAIYEVTVVALLNSYGETLGKQGQSRLEKALRKIKNTHSASDQAWALRHAMDDVYTMLEKQEARQD